MPSESVMSSFYLFLPFHFSLLSQLMLSMQVCMMILVTETAHIASAICKTTICKWGHIINKQVNPKILPPQPEYHMGHSPRAHCATAQEGTRAGTCRNGGYSWVWIEPVHKSHNFSGGTKQHLMSNQHTAPATKRKPLANIAMSKFCITFGPSPHADNQLRSPP